MKAADEWINTIKTGDVVGDRLIEEILRLQIIYIMLCEEPDGVDSWSKEAIVNYYLERLKIRWNFAPSVRQPTPSHE